MLIVCASVSGAPGVSAVALGLAALWPRRPGLLVEADAAGGVLAARFGLAQEPGLATLAAAARHSGSTAGPAPFVQPLRLGLHVVAGPGSAETATGALTVLNGHSNSALVALAPVVVADVGRLYVHSPALGLLDAADAVVLVTTTATEHLDHLDIRVPALQSRVDPGRLGVVTVGGGHFSAGEVAERLRVPVWAELPRDRWGAGVLAGRLTGRGWVRTRLAQGLRALAATIADLIPAPSRTPMRTVR